MTFYLNILIPAVFIIFFSFILISNYFIKPEVILKNWQLIICSIIIAIALICFGSNSNTMYKGVVLVNYNELLFIRVMKLIIFQLYLSVGYYNIIINKNNKNSYHNWYFGLYYFFLSCILFIQFYF